MTRVNFFQLFLTNSSKVKDKKTSQSSYNNFSNIFSNFPGLYTLTYSLHSNLNTTANTTRPIRGHQRVQPLARDKQLPGAPQLHTSKCLAHYIILRWLLTVPPVVMRVDCTVRELC